MFYQILQIAMQPVEVLLVGACLLRCWMQYRRISARNAVGEFVFVLSDWIVKPLRRVFPGYAGIDWASLIAALAIGIVCTAILDLAEGLFSNLAPPMALQVLLIQSVFSVLHDAVLLIMAVVACVAVLSWINPFSPVLPVFDAISGPLLRPIRRMLPLFGRFDLSPLVLFVLLQICILLLDEGRKRLLLSLVNFG